MILVDYILKSRREIYEKKSIRSSKLILHESSVKFRNEEWVSRSESNILLPILKNSSFFKVKFKKKTTMKKAGIFAVKRLTTLKNKVC